MRASRTDDLLTENIALATEPADLVVNVTFAGEQVEGAKVQLVCNHLEKMRFTLEDDGTFLFERALPTSQPGACRLAVGKDG